MSFLITRQADNDLHDWAKRGYELGVRFELASRGKESIRLEVAPEEGERRRVGKVTEIETAKMEVFDRFRPTKTRPLPAAYIIPVAQKQTVDLLKLQGIEVERISKDWKGKGERFVISSASQASRAFQGHKSWTLEGDYQEIDLTSSCWLVSHTLRSEAGHLSFLSSRT